MPKEFALVARCKTLRGALRKTSAQLTEDEKEAIFDFVDIAKPERPHDNGEYFHLLGRFMLFECDTNPVAEKTPSHVPHILQALGNFAEGIDLPANLVPEIEFYLTAWDHLARAYEQIAKKVEQHHAALAS